MKPQNFGLDASVLSQLKAIFDNHQKIKEVLIYGSRAKGNFTRGSDIDLTLIGPELTFSDLLHIENEIDDLLLPYKVDLSLYHKIENQNLRDHIDRVGTKLSC